MKDNNLWEEKNLIEQNPNYLNCKESEQNDIINVTEIDLMKNPCKNIGKISGIYKIINKVNGKYYVGSSKNINIGTDCRFKSHLRYLKSNNHSNDHLQYAWNKYKIESFEFKIIEVVDINNQNLLEIEQKYLDIAKTEKEKTYNLCFAANGGELSEYSKFKKIKALKQNYKLNPHLSKNHSNKMKKWYTDNKNNLSYITNEWRTKLSSAQKLRHSNIIEKQKHLHVMNLKHVKKKISESLKSYYSNNLNISKKRAESRQDKTIYFFKNESNNQEYSGTQYEFRNMFKFNKSSVGNLIKDRNRSLHGWILIKK
jgi:group I intron endonuclease